MTGQLRRTFECGKILMARRGAQTVLLAVHAAALRVSPDELKAASLLFYWLLDEQQRRLDPNIEAGRTHSADSDGAGGGGSRCGDRGESGGDAAGTPLRWAARLLLVESQGRLGKGLMTMLCAASM